MARWNPLRKRWWLLIFDARNVVIYNQSFRTFWGAEKHGRAIASPPLNHYTVSKDRSW